MTVRSHRLVGPQPVAAAGSVVATVPAGETWIVKSVRVVCVVDEAVDFDLAVNMLDAAHAVWWSAGVPLRGVVSDSDWWVLESGDELHARASVDAGLTLMCSGARLVG